MQPRVLYEKYLKHMLVFKEGLKSSGRDYETNLRNLLALCGDLLEADFVLYNALVDGEMQCRCDWNAPPEMTHSEKREHHLCQATMLQQPNESYIITDLPSSKYAEISKCVRRHGLKSYIGHPIYIGDHPIGVLCAFFSREKSFDEENLAFMEIIANFVSAEEECQQKHLLHLQSESDYQKLYQMLRPMCDNSPDMIWAKDTQNHYLFTNEVFCRKVLNAKDTDEPIGKTDMFFAQRQRDLHPDDPNWHTFGEICRDSDTIVIETQQPHRFDEYGNICGNFLRLDVRKTPFYDPDGRFIGTVGSARDVTIEKEIEDAIRDSRERYQAILDSNPDLMFLYDENGIYLDCRVVDEAMMVAKPEDMLGKSVYDMLPKHLADETLTAIHHVRDTGNIYVHEYSLELGQLRYFDSRFVPCGNDRYLSIIRDITDRRLAEIRHHEIEKKYRQIFETANEGILTMDHEHRIVETNQKFCEMLGYCNEELIGKLPSYFLFEDDLPDHYKRLKERKIGKNDVYERRSRKKDGSALWTIISATSILDEAGNFVGSFAMMQDITARRVIEQKMSDSLARYALQRNSMTHISVSQSVPLGNVESLVHEITTMAANVMEVERVSVWLFDESQPLLNCIDLYESTPKRHSSGFILLESEYRSEFAFLKRDKWMDADDPYTDPRTKGYVETYLKPNNIRSMLDIVIRSSGKDYGAICFEHVNQAHHWEVDEISFAFQLADQIALSIASRERLKAESALRDSEERYRLLLDMAPIGIGLFSDEKIMFINPEGARIIGEKNPEILIGNPIRDFIHELSIEDAFIDLAKLIPGEKDLIPAEYFFKRKDGSPAPVEVTATILNYRDKPSIQIIFSDISERKKAEQHIRRNIERLTSIANILQYKTESVQGFLDFALSEAVRLSESKLGYIMSSTPDADGNYIINSLYRHGEHSPDNQEEKIRLQENGISMHTIRDAKPMIINDLKTSSFYGNGVPDWHDTINNLISIPIIYDAKVMAVIALANKPRDYSDTDVLQVTLLMDSVWKMVENRKSDEHILKLSRAVEQSPVSIMITGICGNIEYVNDFFCRITGYSANEVLGKNPRFLKSGETPDEVYAKLWNTISSGDTWNGEFHNRKANGDMYWESASITPVTDKEGRIINYLGVKEDITLKKLMTAELIQARDKAEEMNRLKSSFLANMSHELRTPLVGILGYSELLSNMISDSEQQDMAQTINSSGKRLLNTLNLILDLSRIEANRQDIHMSCFDLNTFVNDKANLFKAAALRKGLELKLHPLEEALNLVSDPHLLEHVINDLINNAIKFTNRGSVSIYVDIVQEIDGCKAQIRIVDTGIGIPSDRLETIFDGFRQVSEGYDRTFTGTGLGLTISKRYTELLGGSISVESEIGIGSTFTISFPEKYLNPLSYDLPEKTDYPEANSAEKTRNKKVKPRILLIDNDSISCQLIEKFLLLTAKLDFATNSEAGLRIASEYHYPVIMLDINLGNEEYGLELVDQIRRLELHKTTPIIAVTAYSMVGDRERFIAHGCSHYLSKPFTREELLEMLGQLL